MIEENCSDKERLRLFNQMAISDKLALLNYMANEIMRMKYFEQGKYFTVTTSNGLFTTKQQFNYCKN